MAPKIERVTEGHLLGEAPHWDVKTQSLYFVDIYGETIHKYTPSTKKLTKVSVGSRVSFIIPIEGHPNEFVICKTTSALRISWDGESDKFTVLDTLCQVDTGSNTPSNTFNDAKCDALGRLWAGTMSTIPEAPFKFPVAGSLYSFDQTKQVKKHLTDLRVANGLAWNATNDKMYFIDSSKGTVDQLDFDVKNGNVSNLQPIFTLGKHNLAGFPDGMTIDSDGNLWVALMNGHRIIKIDPRKPETLLDSIELPAKQVTSAAFGGSNLDELYVTTGCLNMPGQEGGQLAPPVHGATYRITGTGSKGLPPVNVVL